MSIREKAQRIVDAYEAMAEMLPALCGEDVISNSADVCRAYLFEHQADDGEEIKREWLISVGGHKEDHPVKVTFNRQNDLTCRIGFWNVDDGWKVMAIHHKDAATCIARGLKTRGDVRLLCKALGIELKEKQP